MVKTSYKLITPATLLLTIHHFESVVVMSLYQIILVDIRFNHDPAMATYGQHRNTPTIYIVIC